MPAFRRRAFSLIELMVVVAIMGILAALLFPALNTARARAYDPDCQNNLRQLGNALYQYATTQSGGTFPLSTSTGPSNMSALVNGMVDYIPSDAPSWVCKRYAKVNQNDISAILAAGAIGYFYWAGSNLTTTAESSATTPWVTATYTNIGVVLMSDVFSAAPKAQYHGGAATDISLSQPATHVLMLGGTVKKIAPKS